MRTKYPIGTTGRSRKVHNKPEVLFGERRKSHAALAERQDLWRMFDDADLRACIHEDRKVVQEIFPERTWIYYGDRPTASRSSHSGKFRRNTILSASVPVGG
ncbi:MAG: hypothetical protein ACLFM5_11845, partial [Spirochaetaceae bacterium]